MLIYKITNLINGKIYIGQTARNLKTRWDNHVWCALNEKSNSKIHQAIRKYGENKFSIEVIARCTSKKQMDQMEIKTINDDEFKDTKWI